MLLNPFAIHYFAAVVALLLSGLGLSFGFSCSMDGLFAAFERQAAAMPQLNKLIMYGMLMIESSFIGAFIVAIFILFPAYETLTLAIAISELGMGLAVGLCACMVGVASAFALRGACLSVARQPLLLNKIQMLTMIIQTLIETPIFFAFVVALLIKTRLTPDLSLTAGIQLLAAGAVIGLASIGPSIGQLLFAGKSCSAIGTNRHAYNKIFTFTILTEAFLETPLLFGLVLSIMLLFKKVVLAPLAALGLFTAIVFGITLGTAGSGIGIGYLTAKSVQQIAHEPENYPTILKFSVLCQILIETSAIFAFIVVLMMFFQGYAA